jgi:hypothetical protein
MTRLRAAAFGPVCLLGLAACKTSGFSALQSVNPVMLGPVTSLGSGPAPGAAVQGFQSRSADHSDLIIGLSQDGNTATVAASHMTSSPNKGDFDVLVATDGDPTRRVAASRVGCGGYDFNMLFLWYIADSWCETSGKVVSLEPPSAAAPSPPADVYQDDDPVALTDFRTALDPYGAWVDDPTYGTVWVPSAAAIGSGFTPYSTSGHWVHDDDWIWVSDYDWGWAPFHYGRWVLIAERGWAWVPGRQYRGAWVSWQVDDGYAYMAWSPAPPEFVWRVGAPVAFQADLEPSYVYVGRDDVFSPVVGQRVLAPEATVSVRARMHPNNAESGDRTSGPPPEKLGYTPERVPHASPADQAKLAPARGFSRPSTAQALGAHPPTRTASAESLAANRRATTAPGRARASAGAQRAAVPGAQRAAASAPRSAPAQTKKR